MRIPGKTALVILALASCAPLSAAASFAGGARPSGRAATPREKALCHRAVGALDRFLDRQDDSCAADTDCSGYYYRADACRPAVMLRKPGVASSLRKHLGDLQDEVLNACRAAWARRPACSPIPFQARCSKGRCVDARR